jgi:O-antigen ligase
VVRVTNQVDTSRNAQSSFEPDRHSQMRFANRYHAVSETSAPPRPASGKPRTLNEKQAVLACYLISQFLGFPQGVPRVFYYLTLLLFLSSVSKGTERLSTARLACIWVPILATIAISSVRTTPRNIPIVVDFLAICIGNIVLFRCLSVLRKDSLQVLLNSTLFCWLLAIAIFYNHKVTHLGPKLDASGRGGIGLARISMAAFVLLALRSKEEPSTRKTVGLLMFTALTALPILDSGSRTFLLTALLVICFALLKNFRQGLVVVPVLIGLAICIVKFVPSVHSMVFANRETLYLADRPLLWGNGMSAWKESPLLGSGLGTYRDKKFGYTYPHNSVILVLAEMGILGLISLVSIITVKHKPASGNSVIFFFGLYWFSSSLFTGAYDMLGLLVLLQMRGLATRKPAIVSPKFGMFTT